MTKTAKIKNIKLQIKKLQNELANLQKDVHKCKIYWIDTQYGNKHVATVVAKNAAAAKKTFVTKQLNVVKHDAEQGLGAWNELVGYIINRVIVK